MRYGISVPAFADFSNPPLLAELARDAENAGWDGFCPVKGPGRRKPRSSCANASGRVRRDCEHPIHPDSANSPIDRGVFVSIWLS